MPHNLPPPLVTCGTRYVQVCKDNICAHCQDQLGWVAGGVVGWVVGWGGCLVPHHRTVTQVIRMPIGVTIPCQTGPIVAGLTRARHVFCPNLNGLSDCLTCPYCACALSIKLEHS